MSDCQSAPTPDNSSTKSTGELEFRRGYLSSFIRSQVKSTFEASEKEERLIARGCISDTDNSCTKTSRNGVDSELVEAVTQMYSHNFSKIMATASSITQHMIGAQPRTTLEEEVPKSRLKTLSIYEACNERVRKYSRANHGKLCRQLKRVSDEISTWLNADVTYGSSCSVFCKNFIEKTTQYLLCSPTKTQLLSGRGEFSIMLSRVCRLPDFAEEKFGIALRDKSLDWIKDGECDAKYLIELTTPRKPGDDSIVERYVDDFLADKEAMSNLVKVVEYLEAKLSHSPDGT